MCRAAGSLLQIVCGRRDRGSGSFGKLTESALSFSHIPEGEEKRVRILIFCIRFESDREVGTCSDGIGEEISVVGIKWNGFLHGRSS